MSRADQHLDHETLAELAEGLLDEEDAGEARTHLAGCAECRAREQDVSNVSALLGEMPAPPMPSHVADRVEAALDEQRSPQVESARNGAKIIPFPIQRTWMQVGAAAAAAVVIAVGTFGVVGDSLLGGTATSQHEVLSQPGAEQSRETESFSASVAATGRTYSSTKLSAQALDLLREQAAGTAAVPKKAAPRGLSALAQPQQLQACIGQVTSGHDYGTVAVDLARYEGRSAAVIVATDPSSPVADVWVVGPHCSASRADVITHRQVQR